MTKKIGLIIPTLNAGIRWEKWLEVFQSQKLKPKLLLVIDSTSTDNTVALSKKYGFKVKQILKNDFNHGGTRQMGVEILSDAELLVFLTQDALLKGPMALHNLIKPFEDSKVGMSYGRQIPNSNANPVASHARLFNYSTVSRKKLIKDINEIGIKTVFCSNSFAAYRRTALLECGGFPTHTIFGEDTYIASKLILKGWKVAYCADAIVYHSHNYSLIEEFKRYFDIGAFHSMEPWILENFGGASGEGFKYVKSEIKYISLKRPYWIFRSLLTSVVKLIAYRIGRKQKMLPFWSKRKLSMHQGYWR